MNGITKNDLSYNETKLDFEALLKTAAFATSELRQQIKRLDSQLGDDLLHGNITGIHLESQWLSEYAQSLAIAADTYSALLGAKTREDISIINHMGGGE
uniref:Uncharacterized protein n=1 Tax=viral metagenome TaxID=1070528 RepID=A0A6H1ZJH4_9ZZZZ